MLEITDFKDIPRTECGDKRLVRKQELKELLDKERWTSFHNRSELRDGLFLQFGVHRATTLNYAAKERPDVTWHGFDSFEGLPCKWDMGCQVVSKDHFRLTALPEVEPNVVLVKGWYKDTVPEFAKATDKPIAFMDIDCDVYESARDVLHGMNNHIVPGTWIRFDELCDWHLIKFEKRTSSAPYTTWREHEWKALMEWMQAFDREVRPIHRNSHWSATVEVTK